MKFANGNSKLGENCLVVSRPVGDTCPSSCEFLGNGCYAEKTEKMYPNVRKSYLQNVITNKNKIRAMLLLAKAQNKSVRIHTNGDWLKDGELDLEYLQNWIDALTSIRPELRPAIWCYTHVYDSRILVLEQLGVSLYASIGGSKQKMRASYNKAKKAGFSKFAFADSGKLFSTRKQHGKPHTEQPKFLEVLGERFLVCPEMRLGRERVTCTGTCKVSKEGEIKKTTACNYCTNGRGHVFFPIH